MAISLEARARWRAWRDAGGEAAAPLVGGPLAEHEMLDLGAHYLVLGPYAAAWREFLVIRKSDGTREGRFRRKSVVVGTWSIQQGIRGLEDLPELIPVVEPWLKARAKPAKKTKGKSR